jgi:2-(1,2-epoxy-1,2-dihydrophenyl)acetyl-CoA isomerase
MSEPIILINKQNGIVTISLNRVDKANAFNEEMLLALLDALRQVNEDEEIRCVILTGQGNFFSAGQDLSVLQTEEPIDFHYHLERTYNRIILQLRNLEKPVLAVINGTVAGAALGIVLACDLRICADNARFVVGFLGIGLVPDSAVSLFLPQVIGLGRAAEAAFSNQPISAQQALDWGLVNQLVALEELEDTTFQMAQLLTLGPTNAYSLTKKAFNRAVLPNLEEVLSYEAQLQAIAGRSAEHREGVQAFLEKRAPNFRGLK